MHQSITDLMAAVLALLHTKADPMALTPAMLVSAAPRAAAPPPADLPVLSLIPAIAGRAAPETRAVCDRLAEARAHLPWRQTYSEADGFDRAYLDTYGWTDLAGPAGPYRAEGIRIMIGYWGQGLIYPDHSHPPEEHYLVLAGSARFRLDTDPFETVGPGGVFHVPARAVHSAEMRDEALLAISVWRAEDLSVRINLTDDDRDVALD